MPILFLLALVSTSTLGLLLAKSLQEEKDRFARRPPSAVETDVVDSALYGAVYVKIYRTHNAYEAHVYWHGRFIGKAGGFADTEAAKGWGKSFARQQGADV